MRRVLQPAAAHVSFSSARVLCFLFSCELLDSTPFASLVRGERTADGEVSTVPAAWVSPLFKDLRAFSLWLVLRPLMDSSRVPLSVLSLVQTSSRSFSSTSLEE